MPASELVDVLGDHFAEMRVGFGERLATLQAVGETQGVVQIARLAEPSRTLGAWNARLRVGARHEPDFECFVVRHARQ